MLATASAAGDHPPLQPESFRAARIDAAIKSTRLQPSSIGEAVYHLRLLFAMANKLPDPYFEGKANG